MSTTSDAVATEPVAIVGVGCRFPGGVHDFASFGALIDSGTDAFGPVPPDRWGGDLHDPAASRPGTVANHTGAFLDDIDRFDAEYFGVSPREADFLDPQQRILLEVAWEAMSDAGRPRPDWRGSDTAVFVGVLANDYQLLHTRTLRTSEIGPYSTTGHDASFAAGRLAYAFDLHGPVATISTACSSSLLAVHQACQSLRAQECDTALAGGVSLLIGPDLSIFLSSVGAVSPSGRCRPFDASADGLVRGEGCAVVVLKRLGDALADGDRIHAVIRASATRHDGASLGLTAPNAAAQAAMMRTALHRAGLEPCDVGYVEAHGTGTQLGDQIELGALAAVYGAERSAPLLVGSIKAAIGHTDAAAGVAGLLKAAWVAARGRVPAQPNFDTPTPAVDWPRLGIAVPTQPEELVSPDAPTRAGVSAFGLSGTNVHAIVEAAPTPEVRHSSSRGPFVLLASSAREEALPEQLAYFRKRIADGEDLGELAASAATRSTLECFRYAAVGTEPDELLPPASDPWDLPEGAFTGLVADSDSVPPPVFVYPGQGGQWPGMAVDLYEADRGIHDTLDECDDLIRAEAGWSLIDELRRASAQDAERTDRAQPAIFAVQVAVTRWLGERGVRPCAVVGHSMGEVAAAHASGTLTLPDAVRVIVRRAELLHGTAGTGLMYVVGGDAQSVVSLLECHGLPATVAAVNGPTSTVIAGSPDTVGRAAEVLEQCGLQSRRLRVDVASHSPLVASCGPRLVRALAGLEPATPSVRLLSTVYPDSDAVHCDATYWGSNVTEPVRLWPVIDRLLSEDDYPLLEIGPHPVLVRALSDTLNARERLGPAIGTLHRDKPGLVALYQTLACLHAAGVPVDWEAVTGRPRRYRPLPGPVWGGDRFWLPGVARGFQDDSRKRPGPPWDGPEPGHRDRTVPVPPSASGARPKRGDAENAEHADAEHAGPKDVLARVEAVVRGVLGLAAERRILRRRGLFEQGLDSMTAVRLRLKLEEEFGVELPTPFVFANPTIAALAEQLMQHAPAQAPVASQPADDGPGEVDDAIAVIGIACRLPGASDPDAFWDLLAAGRNSVGDPPPGRRDDPVWSEAGSQVPTRSCYLDDVAGFDAPFFRISPREAKSIDPQQRLMLEVAWDALEDAGYRARALQGRKVGVYVGLEAADYQQLLARDMSNVNLYYGTGTSFAAVAGRLSYFLGLSGPSLVVDTACSAALTAVHLACQGLRAGDCETAVVGGAHVMVAPTLLVAMAESGALAADGWCKTFDQDADGYGCGEGAVVLVLKPLAAAQRDDDRVYGVIRASAVNQDGASGGFTVPNKNAQTALIRQALERAGWGPADVDYVEAHGTGTPLGDPIEVGALAEVYGAGRDSTHPLLIGSAKPNVGHLAAAAGVVGLLKVLLSLKHHRIPPHLVAEPSSRIDWDQLPVALPTRELPWPDRGRPARAAVSAFGLTGTNVHVLVEQAPAERMPDAAVSEPFHVLPVTAATASALRSSAARMAGRLRSAPEDVAEIVATATYRRSLLDHRMAVVGDTVWELIEGLEHAAEGARPDSVRFGQIVEEESPDVVFWYGAECPSQRLRSRLVEAPAFRRALESCGALLAELTGVPCDPAGAPPPGMTRAFLVCQHIAATSLWADHGVVPAASCGEELAVAWATGRMSMREALGAALENGSAHTDRVPLEAGAVAVLPTDEDEADPLRRIALAVADLLVDGYEPVADTPRGPLSLPGYPWEHRPYWYRALPEPPAATAPDQEPAAAGGRAKVDQLAQLLQTRWTAAPKSAS